MRSPFILTVLIGALAAASASAAVTAPTPIVLTLKNHRFAPNQINAPAGQKISIQLRNLDPTPEEFESHDIKFEKIVAPHSTITVTFGPLKPGVYAFFGEFNPEKAKGTLTVTATAAPAKPKAKAK